MAFGRKTDEVFYPNCRPKKGTSEGTLVLECQPKLKKDGQIFAGDRPTTIIVQAGGDAIIEDDGGAPDFVLKKLTDHIKENGLD